jgi:hypothetical protein
MKTISYISKPTANKRAQTCFFGGYNLALKNVREKIEKLKNDYVLMGICLGVEDPDMAERYKAKIDVCKDILSIIENEKL